MSERSGVEIDYCPTCRGVWLDRGELDKILDRAAAEMPGRAAPTAPAAPFGGDGFGGAASGPSDNRGYDNRGYDNRGYDNRGYGDRDQRDGRDRSDRDGYGPGAYGRDGDGRGRKKRESWLSDLFD
jgi:Zn-finger nucleic acid-binding protein